MRSRPLRACARAAGFTAIFIAVSVSWPGARAEDDLEGLLSEPVPAREASEPGRSGDAEPDPDARPAPPPGAGSETSAPEPSAPLPPARPRSGVIEEIVVTAQKRAANLQDVPISMTALGGDDVAFRQIRGLQDLQYDVPGLTYGEREGGASVTIRGVGLNVNFGPFEGGVATHIDGQYQPVITSGVVGVNDLERVEVLRGPQGTLYGRNATGGAINFLLKKPTEEFEGTLRLGYGSFDTKNVFGLVSGPLVRDVLLARVYGEYDLTDGFIDNLTLNRTVGDREGYGGRVALRWLPLDTLTTDLSLITRRDLHAPAFVMITPPRPDLEAQLSIPPSDSETWVLWGDRKHAVKEQRRGLGHRETSNATNTIAWDSPWASVKSITGAQYHYLDLDYDDDAQARPTFHVMPYRGRSVSVSQELNLAESLPLWWGTKLDWLLGGFFFTQQYDTLINIDIESSVIPGLAVFTRTEQETSAYAGFGDATLWVTDWLRIFGGLRQSFEDKELVQTLLAVAGPNRDPIPPPPDPIGDLIHVRLCDTIELATSFDNLSPRYGIQVDATDSIMIYAQRALGFKAGGANPFACNNVFAPEEVDSKEIGVKSTWFDERLVANLGFFLNAYSDFQIQKTTGLEGPVVNADEASIRGMEVELHARPFGGTSSALAPLELQVAGALLRARYDEFTDTDPANPGPGVQDLKGNPMNRAPDYTVNVGIEYPWSLGFGTVRARSEWFVTDDVYFRQFALPDDRQTGYSLWNAYVSVASLSEAVELRAFGKNILDTDYLTNIAAQQHGTHYGEAGAPASWGTELVLRF